MEAAQALLLRPMDRTLSEDDCSVDQSSRDNTSPSDSAFHSDFSFISIQDLGNSLSGNISFPYSGKTPISWADDRSSSRPSTTATFRLLAFRQRPTFYSVREQTRKCRIARDLGLLSKNEAPESDEYSPSANDEQLPGDSDAYQGRRRHHRCLQQVPPGFEPDSGHLGSALSPSAVLSVVKKARHAAAAAATEVDDAAGAGACRDVGKSPSRDSCEYLTLFGDDEESVASEVLWSPSSPHNPPPPPPSRPDFVPQLDLSWVVEDEKSVGKRRSRQPTAGQSRPNERPDHDCSVECKMDAKPATMNSRYVIEKSCFGSLRSKESNHRGEANCGIQTSGTTSLTQQNDNHHRHQQQQHHLCSEDGTVEKDPFYCLDGRHNFDEERPIRRPRNTKTSAGHSTTSSESLRERAVKSLRTRSLEVQVADRAPQNQGSKSDGGGAFPSGNVQKSSSLSVIDTARPFLIDKTVWTTKEIDEYSRESVDNSLSPSSCREKGCVLDYYTPRGGCRTMNASKPAIVYYVDENAQQNGPSADGRTRASTESERSGTAYYGGTRFYDVEAAVERRHNRNAKRLSLCNFAFSCLCCRTNCRCNYSCCRWGFAGEDQ